MSKHRRQATPEVLTLKKPIMKTSRRKTKSSINIKTKRKNAKKSIDTKETEVEVNATSIDVVVSNAPVDQNNIKNEETPRILNIEPAKKSSRKRKNSERNLKSSSVLNATTNVISTKMDTGTQIQNAASNIISTEKDTSEQILNASSNIISTEMDTSTQETPRILNIEPAKKSSRKRKNSERNLKSSCGKKNQMKADTSTLNQNATTNVISTKMDTGTQIQNAASNIISTEKDTSAQILNASSNIISTKMDTSTQVEKVVLPPAETPNMNSETSLFMNHLNSEVTYFRIPKVISQANTPLNNPPKSTPLSLNIEEESKKTESLTITKIVPEYNIVLNANPFCERNNEIAPTEIHKKTLSKPETTAHKPETTAHIPEIGFELRKLTNKNQELQQIIPNKVQIVARNEFRGPSFITKMPLSLTSKMNGSLLTNSNNKVPDIPKPPTHPETLSDSHVHTKPGLYEIKTESELSSRQEDTESNFQPSNNSCMLVKPIPKPSLHPETVRSDSQLNNDGLLVIKTESGLSSPQDDTESCELSSRQEDTESNFQPSNNSCMLVKPIPKPSLHPETVRSDSQLNNDGLLVIKTESELLSPQDDTESCELSSPQTNIISGELQESNSFSMLLTHKEMLAVQPKPSLNSVIVSPKTEPQTTISISTDEGEIRTITTDDVLASMKCATTTKEMLSIVEREFDDVKIFYESRLTSITDTCVTQIEECDQKVKDETEKCDKKINEITTEYETKLKNQKEFYEKQIQELNKKIDDTKKKMWCKWCLSEAKFMCCPVAYYCSPICKQYDEAHRKICPNKNLVELNSESRSLKIVKRNASNMINVQANNTMQEQSNTKLFRSLPLGKKYIILKPKANPTTIPNVRFVPTSQPNVLKEANKATGSTAYSNVKTTGYDRPSMVNTIKKIDLPGTSKSQYLQKKNSTILPEATTVNPTHDDIIALNDSELANIMKKNYLGDLS